MSAPKCLWRGQLLPALGAYSRALDRHNSYSREGAAIGGPEWTRRVTAIGQTRSPEARTTRPAESRQSPKGRLAVGAGPVALDGGSFLGEPVPLGELMTDGAGRLVFLPAQGRGYSPDSTPLGSFAESPGWTDDVCDGAVSATVRLGDRVLQADPAWVVATPPNYAPAIATGLVTAYDAARSALVDAGMIDAGQVSFASDILPIFARLVDLQWVSAAFFASNGFGSAGDWLGDGMVARLANASPGNAAFRREVLRTFRNPSFSQAQPNAVPQLYGDHVGFPVASNRQWYAVTPLQYRKLEAWAAGDFTENAGAEELAASLDEVPLQLRPGALDRAALDSVLGGAFHPGIEVPWTLRCGWTRCGRSPSGCA